MTLRGGATIALWAWVFAACSGQAEPNIPDGGAADACVQCDAMVGAGRDAPAHSLEVSPVATAAAAPTSSPIRGMPRAEGMGSATPPARASVETAFTELEALDAMRLEDPSVELSSLAIATFAGGIRALLGTARTPSHREPVRVLEDGDMVMGVARAGDQALGTVQRAWRGRAVHVWTAQGRSCSGRISDLELATPWIWKEDLLGEPAPEDAAAALESWLSVIVGRVTLDDPETCSGRPLLVLDADAARRAPRIAEALPHVPRRRQVLSAFRRLPRYRALQRQCLRDSVCALDAAGGQAPHRDVTLRAFRFPGETQVYVIASIAEGTCGAWGPPMSAIFIVEAAIDARPRLHRVNRRAELGSPELLLDAERDGRLELLTERFAGDIELLDEEGATLHLWSTTFVGCRC